MYDLIKMVAAICTKITDAASVERVKASRTPVIVSCVFTDSPYLQKHYSSPLYSMLHLSSSPALCLHAWLGLQNGLLFIHFAPSFVDFYH